MAATVLIILTYFLIFNVFTNNFKSNSYSSEDFYPYKDLQHKLFRTVQRTTGFDKQTVVLMLHFNLERSYVPDLTIHMDVHPNPGLHQNHRHFPPNEGHHMLM